MDCHVASLLAMTKKQTPAASGLTQEMLMEGCVLAGTNNLFTVECSDGVVRNCTIKGKVLKSEKEFYNPIAPGDIVQIEIDPLNDAKGQIISLNPNAKR